jgi:glycosyltransferase involved in cell wall biosynthesis
LKILLVNKFFFHKAGAETVFFQERDYLMRTGHEIVDFAMQHPDNLPSEYGKYFVPHVEYRGVNERTLSGYLKQLRIAKNFVYNRYAANSLRRLIEKERPEIAHLHNAYHQITPVIIPILKKAGIRIVLTLHDYKLLCPVYSMLRHGKICSACQGRKFWHVVKGRCEIYSISRSMLLALEAYWHFLLRSYDHVDLFLAPSNFMAEIMARYRLKRSQIEVLRNGVDAGSVSPFFEGGQYALYVGRISPEKGIKTLLNVFQYLDWPLPLKIVGSGPLLDVYRTQYPRAEFVGYKSGSELQELYRHASFVVVPSEWYENCSMVVLEAMSYGKPVIASNIGGIPEQVKDGVTGFLFTSGDMYQLSEKISLINSDSVLRKQLGVQARERLKREFAYKDHYRQLMGIFRRIRSIE